MKATPFSRAAARLGVFAFLSIVLSLEAHTSKYIGPLQVDLRGEVRKVSPGTGWIPRVDGRRWVFPAGYGGPVAKIEMKEILDSDSWARWPMSPVTRWVPFSIYVPAGTTSIKAGDTVELRLKLAPFAFPREDKLADLYRGTSIEAEIVPASGRKAARIPPDVDSRLKDCFAASGKADRARLKALVPSREVDILSEMSASQLVSLGQSCLRSEGRWYVWSGGEDGVILARCPLMDKDGNDWGVTFVMGKGPLGARRILQINDLDYVFNH